MGQGGAATKGGGVRGDFRVLRTLFLYLCPGICLAIVPLTQGCGRIGYDEIGLQFNTLDAGPYTFDATQTGGNQPDGGLEDANTTDATSDSSLSDGGPGVDGGTTDSGMDSDAGMGGDANMGDTGMGGDSGMGPLGVETTLSHYATTELGSTVELQIRLQSAPAAPVTLSFSSSDPSEGQLLTTTSMVFNSGDWNTYKPIIVTGQDDAIADGPIIYSIDFTYSSADVNWNNLSPGNVPITNEDDEAPILVSGDLQGTPGNGFSWNAAVSSDTTHVVFETSSSNFSNNDSDNKFDVYRYDIITRQHELVSANQLGQAGAGGAVGSGYTFGVAKYAAAGGGRHVAFESTKTDLVNPTTSGTQHLYMRDMLTEQTILVSQAFDSSEADAPSSRVAMSSDGCHVVYLSPATNLIPGDANGRHDNFYYDYCASRTNSLLSIRHDMTQQTGIPTSPAIGANGTFAAFYTSDTQIVPTDTNGKPDVFVRDLAGMTNEIGSLDSMGGQGNNSSFFPHLSSDGRLVAFLSYASNLVAGDTNGQPDVFRHDRISGQTIRVSLDGNGQQIPAMSELADMTDDGNLVLFRTTAALTPEDTNSQSDLYIRDINAGETRLVPGGTGAVHAAMSGAADGGIIVFSTLTSLVPADNNGKHDVYMIPIP